MSDRQGGSRLTVPALTAMEPMFKRCAPIDAEQDIGDLVIVETFSLGTRCLATAPATPDRRCDTGDAKQCRYVIAHAHRDCTQGHGAERLAGDHKPPMKCFTWMHRRWPSRVYGGENSEYILRRVQGLSVLRRGLTGDAFKGFVEYFGVSETDGVGNFIHFHGGIP